MPVKFRHWFHRFFNRRRPGRSAAPPIAKQQPAPAAVATAIVPRSMVLFLDFCGVLHPDGAPKHREFIYVPHLEAVLRDFPGVHVVISSTWARYSGLDELRVFFSPDLRRRIVDSTPSARLLGQAGAAYERQVECEAWLRMNAPDERWLAVDDCEFLYSPECDNLFHLKPLSDGTTGLTPEWADQLRQRLETTHSGGR